MDTNTDKIEKSPAPVVSIDGAKIRTIRDAKKLTQLYVASVVGVTTDTISRWENNRYPSIKRDNAEKLAAALEVELAEICREESLPLEEAAVDERPAPHVTFRSLYPIIALSVFSIIILVFLLVRSSGNSAQADRKLPRFSPAGEIIPVQIVVKTTPRSSAGMIIREKLPPGWRMVSSRPTAASQQGATEEIKWLLPPGAERQTISYTVRSPESSPINKAFLFTGYLVVQSDSGANSKKVGGDLEITLSDKHWADRNGDLKIDDNEIMPAYYQTEEMKGMGLDWKIIERIWSSSGYRWDPATHTFVTGR